MYCLTFTENNEIQRTFYYYDFKKAEMLQRNLIIIELNKLIQDPDDLFISGSIKFEGSTNHELQRLLNCILSYKYRDGYINNAIDIVINELIFEDD
jgi:hypothetical protein